MDQTKKYLLSKMFYKFIIYPFMFLKFLFQIQNPQVLILNFISPKNENCKKFLKLFKSIVIMTFGMKKNAIHYKSLYVYKKDILTKLC